MAVMEEGGGAGKCTLCTPKKRIHLPSLNPAIQLYPREGCRRIDLGGSLNSTGKQSLSQA